MATPEQVYASKVLFVFLDELARLAGETNHDKSHALYRSVKLLLQGATLKG